MDTRKKVILIVVGLLAILGIVLGKMQNSGTKKIVKAKDPLPAAVAEIPPVENKKIEDRKKEIAVIQNIEIIEKDQKEEEMQRAKYKEMITARKELYIEKLPLEKQEMALERQKEVQKLSQEFVKQKHKEIQERLKVLTQKSAK